MEKPGVEADKRGQFTFYESFRSAVKKIRKASDRALAYDIICDYALYGTEPELDRLPDIVAMLFINVRPNLDASRRKAESGRRGGQAKQTASKGQANSKQTATKKENEKENKIENEKENKCCAREGGKQAAGDLEAAFAAFWELYPTNSGGRDAAYQAWAGVVTNEQVAEQVISSLPAFLQCAAWLEDGGRYIPSAVKFLSEARWEKPPALPGQAASGERPLDEDEIKAIRRMMGESL